MTKTTYKTIVIGLGLGLLWGGTAWAGGLYGSDKLFSDLDKDGSKERVMLEPYQTSDGICYRIGVYDAHNNLLWQSQKGDRDSRYTCYATTCLMYDIDGDGTDELIFGGRGFYGDGSGNGNAVFVWKNGKFSYSKTNWLVRSKDDTTVYVDTAKPREDGETIVDLDGNDSIVTIANLRKVGGTLWGDVFFQGNITNEDEDGAYFATVQLQPSKRGLIAVSSKIGNMSERTVNNHHWAWFAGSTGEEERITAVPRPIDLKLQADLNGDGQMETVKFAEYYPATYHFARYQIMVFDGNGKCLWKSERQRSRGNASVNSPGQVPGGCEFLMRGQGGLSLYPGQKSMPHSFLKDIDGDGRTELITEFSSRHGSRIETWKWSDNSFRFHEIDKLLRSEKDKDVFLWVEDKRPTWLHSNMEYFGAPYLRNMMVAFKEQGVACAYDCINNLCLKNGEIWGEIGDDGGRCEQEVRLVPCDAGLRVVERK